MISIIICSVDTLMLEKAVKSIADTIGVPYEIITIDNNREQLGICDAYNRGAALAQYDIFCFMHEDILYETTGWGEKVSDHLKSPQVGLIGLAGGNIKSRVPSSWASLISKSEISYIQHYKSGIEPGKKIIETGSPEDASLLKKVVCIDGFWMCTRRDVFQKFKFDAQVYTGFHGYDIDFSLQVLQEYKVAVVFDILLHHYSEGSFSKDWLKNSIRVSEKWQKILPVSSRKESTEALLRQHWTCMRSFIDHLIASNYPLSAICRYYLTYARGDFFHWKHFLHFLKYIFSGYFKKTAI